MKISTKIAALCTSILLAVGLGVVGASTATASPPTTLSVSECVPQDAWTETVVVQEEYLQRYSYNAPWESNTTSPPFPSDDWQANVKGDPHGVGTPGAYFRSNGNSGNGDWFYLELVPAVTETIEHPAVTCPPSTPEEPEPPVDPNTLAETGINARGAALGIGALVIIALGVVAYLWSRYNRKN